MEYKGKIVAIMETVKVSEKFRKREFVVSDEAPSYPQVIIFQTTQDRVDLLNSVKVGDYVNVLFGMKGREWKNPQGEIKYFNTMDAYKVIVTASGTAPQHSGTPQNATTPGTSSETLQPTPDDDLPF